MTPVSDGLPAGLDEQLSGGIGPHVWGECPDVQGRVRVPLAGLADNALGDQTVPLGLDRAVVDQEIVPHHVPAEPVEAVLRLVLAICQERGKKLGAAFPDLAHHFVVRDSSHFRVPSCVLQEANRMSESAGATVHLLPR